MDQNAIEPPPMYTIAFRNSEHANYRISRQVIDQMAQDFRSGATSGAYDVEAPDETYRKLIFHFEDILYIG